VSRRAALVRLGLVLAVLLAAFAAFWVFDLLDEEDVRALVDPFGALAPVAYVVIAAVLGVALVPGPLLAGASGLLFGAALGTAVTIASATLNAVIALLLARRFAGGAFTSISGPRLQAIAVLAERHGVAAVVVQRLAPGVPDAPASYVFGLLGTRVWQIAVGTAIGAAPRAFSYTAIGASLDDPGSALAWVGLAGVVLTGLAGAEVLRRVVRRNRRPAPASPPPHRSGAAHGRTPPSGA
jgi:uncharacterized membrane protein YdjX (TVP38/TMEM64 family)